MEAHNWWSEVVKVQPDGITELRLDMQALHPGIGKSENKKRPKRKPRPKKSARG
jgi:hypothetical protein